MYMCVCVHTPYLPYSFIWTLGCLLSIVNSVALNTGEHVSFQITVFSRYMPKSGIARSYDSF